MFEKTDHILHLINKHFRNDLTPEQRIQLEEWLSENAEHRKLFAQFSDDKIMEEKINLYLDSEIPDAWAKVQQRMNALQPIAKKNNRPRSKTFWQLTTAAILLILITGVTYFVLIKNKETSNPAITVTPVRPKQTFSQPTKKAEITLTDGSKIFLENVNDDSVFNQGGYALLKHYDDLYYRKNNTIPFNENLFNIVTTPPGGQLRIILADSSTITMNVASSIKFNVSAPIRKVHMKGEAEFNITHNPNDPFQVMIPVAIKHGIEGKVEVPGTRFNVYAYEDEKIKKVSLLKGVINVSAQAPQAAELSTAAYFNKALKLFNPGQQAQLQENGSINIIPRVDTVAVVAWKDGFVPFNKTPTLQVLKTLEKWYDVKVIYKNKKVPECLFTGKITPQTGITSVLKIMEFQCDGLRFTFDSTAKTITILP